MLRRRVRGEKRMMRMDDRGLWKWRGGGKRGKAKAAFPLFPPPLGNLAKAARFPHSHSPRRRSKLNSKPKDKKMTDDDDADRNSYRQALSPAKRRSETGHIHSRER